MNDAERAANKGFVHDYVYRDSAVTGWLVDRAASSTLAARPRAPAS